MLNNWPEMHALERYPERVAITLIHFVYANERSLIVSAMLSDDTWEQIRTAKPGLERFADRVVEAGVAPFPASSMIPANQTLLPLSDVRQEQLARLRHSRRWRMRFFEVLFLDEAARDREPWMEKLPVPKPSTALRKLLRDWLFLWRNDCDLSHPNGWAGESADSLIAAVSSSERWPKVNDLHASTVRIDREYKPAQQGTKPQINVVRTGERPDSIIAVRRFCEGFHEISIDWLAGRLLKTVFADLTLLLPGDRGGSSFHEAFWPAFCEVAAWARTQSPQDGPLAPVLDEFATLRSEMTDSERRRQWLKRWDSLPSFVSPSDFRCLSIPPLRSNCKDARHAAQHKYLTESLDAVDRLAHSIASALSDPYALATLNDNVAWKLTNAWGKRVAALRKCRVVRARTHRDDELKSRRGILHSEVAPDERERASLNARVEQWLASSTINTLRMLQTQIDREADWYVRAELFRVDRAHADQESGQ